MSGFDLASCVARSPPSTFRSQRGWIRSESKVTSIAPRVFDRLLDRSPRRPGTCVHLPMPPSRLARNERRADILRTPTCFGGRTYVPVGVDQAMSKRSHRPSTCDYVSLQIAGYTWIGRTYVLTLRASIAYVGLRRSDSERINRSAIRPRDFLIKDSFTEKLISELSVPSLTRRTHSTPSDLRRITSHRGSSSSPPKQIFTCFWTSRSPDEDSCRVDQLHFRQIADR